MAEEVSEGRALGGHPPRSPRPELPGALLGTSDGPLRILQVRLPAKKLLRLRHWCRGRHTPPIADLTLFVAPSAANMKHVATRNQTHSSRADLGAQKSSASSRARYKLSRESKCCGFLLHQQNAMNK